VQDETSSSENFIMIDDIEEPVFVGKMIKRKLKLLKLPFPVNFA
jgi:hypothetical protein